MMTWWVVSVEPHRTIRRASLVPSSYPRSLPCTAMAMRRPLGSAVHRCPHCVVAGGSWEVWEVWDVAGRCGV